MSVATAMPAAAEPVYPNKQAVGVVDVLQPIAVRKLQDLNFATLYAWGGAGSATVDPITDTMTTMGGVTYGTGLAYSALFEAVSPAKGVVIIRIPTKPITVTRVGGTETMTVSNWTLNGSSNRVVVAQEPFQVKVGGTLYVNANQAEGTYLGTFDVTIQNP